MLKKKKRLKEKVGKEKEMSVAMESNSRERKNWKEESNREVGGQDGP